jgi:hypothetical protein
MLAVLRRLLFTFAAAIRPVAGPMSPRRAVGHMLSKHWPSDGIARQAFLAAASISAVVLLAAGAINPYKIIWS